MQKFIDRDLHQQRKHSVCNHEALTQKQSQSILGPQFGDTIHSASHIVEEDERPRKPKTQRSQRSKKTKLLNRQQQPALTLKTSSHVSKSHDKAIDKTKHSRLVVVPNGLKNYIQDHKDQFKQTMHRILKEARILPTHSNPSIERVNEPSSATYIDTLRQNYLEDS
jgi:hypothetical protein